MTASGDVELRRVWGIAANPAQDEATLGSRRRERQGWKGRWIEERLGTPTAVAVALAIAAAVMKRCKRQCSASRSMWRDEGCSPVHFAL